MSKLRLLPMLALAILVSTNSLAQVPVQAAPDHTKLLASPDPRLAANKRLVYDFWLTVNDRYKPVGG